MNGKMRITRITCPLCDWYHDQPDVDPMAADPMALASIFGPGVFAATAAASRSAKIERALEEHFATHTTVEWVGKVSSLERELMRLRAAMP